jgi:hypothetical protein
MFPKLTESELNLYRLSTPIDLGVARQWGQDQGTVISGAEELSLDLTGLTVQISATGLVVKVITPDVESIQTINKLVETLINDQNLVEYLLSHRRELTNFDFFQVLPEEWLHYDKLNPYLKSLTNLGLDFDTKQPSQNLEGTYLAIDCGDYIKFISFDQYSKEKQVKQIIAELCAQTDQEPIVEWLESIYQRYLLNHAFDSNVIHHVLDWMNQLTDFTVLKQSLSLDRALAKADQWVNFNNQKLGISTTRDQEGVDLQTLYTTGSYALSHLISQDAKKREGQKMHNCIGSMHLSNPDLYSVRYNGRRVASLCVRDQKIVEAKGPWNKAVDPEHRRAVRECLSVGLKVNYEVSNDLRNIGLRKLDLDIPGQALQAIIVQEGEGLFDYHSNTIKLDNIYQGSTSEQVPGLISSLLSKFPANLQDLISTKLAEIEKQYHPCPITEILFHEQSEYYRYKFSKLQTIVQAYPEFKTALKTSALEFKAKNFAGGAYKLENLISAVNHLALNLDLLAGPEDRKRLCLHSFTKVDSKFSVIPGLYRPILGKAETVEDLYGKIADYTPLKAVDRNLEELAKILKMDNPSFDADEMDLKIPDECKACDNYKIYQDQSQVAEEWLDKKQEADSLITQMDEALENLKDFASSIMELYRVHHRALLLNPRFNPGLGKLTPNSLAQAKELKAELEEWVQEWVSLYKQFPSSTMQKHLEVMEQGHDRLNDLERTMGKIADQLDRLSGETCYQCPDCHGDGEDDEGETCSTCKGHSEDCGGEKIVDDNRYNKPSVRYAFNEMYAWSHKFVDLNVLTELLSALDDIQAEEKEFVRGVFTFLSDYTTHE